MKTLIATLTVLLLCLMANIPAMAQTATPVPSNTPVPSPSSTPCSNYACPTPTFSYAQLRSTPTLMAYHVMPWPTFDTRNAAAAEADAAVGDYQYLLASTNHVIEWFLGIIMGGFVLRLLYGIFKSLQKV